MTVATAAAGTDPWLRRFPGVLEQTAGEPDWLRTQRQEAMARFVEAGIPGSGLEAWRSTSMAVVARTPWQPAIAAAHSGHLVDQAASLAGDGPVLVMVNGRVAADLSDFSGLPEGTIFCSLAHAVATCPDDVRAVEQKAALAGGHVLGDLNTAFNEDGAFLRLPAGKLCEAPVRVVSLHTGDKEPSAVHPRLLVRAGEGSHFNLVEIHAGKGAGLRLSNCVVDLSLEQGAVLAHTKVEQETAGGVHVGLTRVHQDRDSRYTSVSLATGADLVRNDLLVLLAGEGAACNLDGLYLVDGSRHVDNHLLVEHARPHTTSHQLYKGVLDDEGRGVFVGRVLVQPDAQKVQARQTNNNLLMSDRALAESTPQLEIHADDVQCFHGSTIGQLDDDMIFYLRSRGIAGDRAREVLTIAFANAILERVPVPALRRDLERRLFPEAEL